MRIFKTMNFILCGLPDFLFMEIKWNSHHLISGGEIMNIPHLYLWLLSKRALSDVALRLYLYLQIIHELDKRQVIHFSRRRICRKLSLSKGAVRSAVKQLVKMDLISLCDSKGNFIVDLDTNFILLNKKEKFNWDLINMIIKQMDNPSRELEAEIEAVKDPGLSAGLFDDIMNE